MGEQPILLWCIAIPAMAGLVCYVVGRWAGRLTALIGLATAVVTFVLGCGLPGLRGSGYALKWFEVGGFDVSMVLRVGALSGFAAAFVSLFGLVVVCFSVPYMWSHRYQGRYYAFTLWALAGSMGTMLADHLLFFLLSWEVVTLMLYLLVNLGREPAARVGAKTFVLLGFADAALLLGIVFLWRLHDSKTFLMSEMGRLTLEQTGTTLGTAAFVLMFAGAIAKAGAFPLHTWIPAAAEAAPVPVMAFLPASLDKLLGITLLARLVLQLFAMTQALSIAVMLIGAVTVLGAVMMAMVQHDLSLDCALRHGDIVRIPPATRRSMTSARRSPGMRSASISSSHAFSRAS